MRQQLLRALASFDGTAVDTAAERWARDALLRDLATLLEQPMDGDHSSRLLTIRLLASSVTPRASTVAVTKMSELLVTLAASSAIVISGSQRPRSRQTCGRREKA